MLGLELDRMASEKIGTPLLKCSQCPYESQWLFALDHHEKQHRKPSCWFECWQFSEPYICSQCDYQTSLKVPLIEHNEASHGGFSLVKTENNRTDNSEVETVFDFTKYNCDFCAFCTCSRIVLFLHKCKENENFYLEKNAIVEVKPEIFENESEISELNNVMLDTSFNCFHCLMPFNSANDLKSHMICMHVAIERTKWFECSLCDYRSKSKNLFNKHLSYKHVDCDWLQCSQCSYKAKRKSTLKVHVLCCHTADEEIKWFECAHCPYKAKKRNNLEKHVLFMHSAFKNMRWDELCDVLKEDNTKIFIEKNKFL